MYEGGCETLILSVYVYIKQQAYNIGCGEVRSSEENQLSKGKCYKRKDKKELYQQKYQTSEN